MTRDRPEAGPVAKGLMVAGMSAVAIGRVVGRRRRDADRQGLDDGQGGA